MGRVHVAPIKIGKTFFPSSFTILENQGVEFLLGLDMLKKHQCSIDLKDNCLRIGDEAVPFLAEKDIPKHEGFDDIPSPDDIANSNSNIPQSSNTTTSTSTTNKPPTTAPTTTTTKPQSTPTTANTNAQFSEEIIGNLMGLGFSRDQVVKALTLFKGDADRAASYLFSS